MFLQPKPIQTGAKSNPTQTKPYGKTKVANGLNQTICPCGSSGRTVKKKSILSTSLARHFYQPYNDYYHSICNLHLQQWATGWRQILPNDGPSTSLLKLVQERSSSSWRKEPEPEYSLQARQKSRKKLIQSELWTNWRNVFVGSLLTAWLVSGVTCLDSRGHDWSQQLGQSKIKRANHPKKISWAAK